MMLTDREIRTEPLSDDQLDLLRKIAARDWLNEGDDPYEIAATLHDLLPDLLGEIDRLRAAYEPLGDKWGWCIECDAPWDPVHQFQSCRRIPLYLRKADL